MRFVHVWMVLIGTQVFACAPAALERGSLQSANGSPSKVYTNTVHHEKDSYSLGWPPGTKVTMLVHADHPLDVSAEAIYGEAYRYPEVRKGPVQAGPERPAILRFTMPEANAEMRFRLEAPTETDFVGYTARFEPAPTVEHRLPPPAAPREVAINDILKKTQPEPEFSQQRSGKSSRGTRGGLALDLTRYERVVKKTVPLEQLRSALSFDAKEGYSYEVRLTLADGVSFSPIAQRGLIWREVNTQTEHPTETLPLVEGSRVSTRENALSATKDAHIELTLVPTRCRSCSLGTGDVDVEVLRIARSPSLMSRAAFVHAAKEATQGHTLVESWQGDLSNIEPLSLHAAIGVCQVLVLERAPTATWSPSFSGNLNVGLEKETLHAGRMVGPGVLAAFGCLNSGPMKVAFVMDDGGKALGRGSYTASLYTRKLSAAEVLKERCDACHLAYPGPTIITSAYRPAPSASEQASYAYSRMRFDECVARFAKSRTACD